MNPYDEQTLRDEVIYLHSLWHLGPPSQPSQNPIHHPIPSLHNISSFRSLSSQPYIPPQSHFHAYPSYLHSHHHHRSQPLQHAVHPFTPSHTRSLPPVTSTAFKKMNKKNKNKKDRRRDPDPTHSPGPEWPCPASPNPPATPWRDLKPHSDPPPAMSPQEKERLLMLQAQHKACQAFEKFLVGSDDDEDEDDYDDDDDGLEELEEFFIGVFEEDNELRKYYQRCFENGEFCCFVCGAVGKRKSGKKFKDCVGLVQHSMSILRTVKKQAHRAFGQAVCKVLGWDINRLPTIVMKGNPLGSYEELKPTEAEDETLKL